LSVVTAEAGKPVVEVTGLRKAYRGRGRLGLTSGPRRPALDGLDLVVGARGVHGFLGPNGSGKTTTLRVVLGLVHADAGSVRLLGHEVPGQLAAATGSVGALIEAPQFFPAFSGRRNLSLLAGVAGLPASRVDEVLEQVGLTGRAGDRVRAYSLGMKQRLGIAAALLKKPQLLVLDEPTNGLDPGGIREVRELLRSLGRSGVTVLLSSHLLAEVQHVCDEVTIVARGRAVRSGSVREVLASSAGAGRLRVRLDDQAGAAMVLRRAGMVVLEEPDSLLVGPVADAAEVTRLLAQSGLWLRELRPEAADLEDVFLALTEPALP
jgi:ABC-2 type transport system ATP-binding protein